MQNESPAYASREATASPLRDTSNPPACVAGTATVRLPAAAAVAEK